MVILIDIFRHQFVIWILCICIRSYQCHSEHRTSILVDYIDLFTILLHACIGGISEMVIFKGNQTILYIIIIVTHLWLSIKSQSTDDKLISYVLVPQQKSCFTLARHKELIWSLARNQLIFTEMFTSLSSHIMSFSISGFQSIKCSFRSLNGLTLAWYFRKFSSHGF